VWLKRKKAELTAIKSNVDDAIKSSVDDAIKSNVDNAIKSNVDDAIKSNVDDVAFPHFDWHVQAWDHSRLLKQSNTHTLGDNFWPLF
jgi:hypothetical protein